MCTSYLNNDGNRTQPLQRLGRGMSPLWDVSHFPAGLLRSSDLVGGIYCGLQLPVPGTCLSAALLWYPHRRGPVH
jgi:hypothetical protein